MHTTTAESVEEAVKLAEGLKRAGSHDWFRGQRRDWPLRSSLARLGRTARATALEQLARYEHWVKTTPGLEYLAEDIDGAIAVAQHYGLPTNFVDFTTEPRIAGFFASEASRPHEELSCIICLSTLDLKEFWEAMPSKYPPPETLALDVPGLWRLEAQYGCFLYCPYEDIERIYDFDRILFRNTGPLQGIRKNEVYPQRKSRLEILLDQYFMNEQLIKGSRDMNGLQFERINLGEFLGGCDPDVYPQGLPEHPSWSDSALEPWLRAPGHSFFESRTPRQMKITLKRTQDLRSLAIESGKQALDALGQTPEARLKLVNWQVTLDDDGLPEDYYPQLSSRLARLWDGLRTLPYEDADIAAGIGMCIALSLALRGDFRNPDGAHWKSAAEVCLADPLELEFGAADGSYSRAYVARDSILSAVRKDIYAFMSPRWKDALSGDPRSILQVSWNPRGAFDFDVLNPLFAREIAPYQVLARETAVFYCAARLDRMGLP